MLRLPLPDELDQRVEVVSAGGEQITSPLTDFVDEDIHGPVVRVAHVSFSDQTISLIDSTARPKNPVGSVGLWGNLMRR